MRRATRDIRLDITGCCALDGPLEAAVTVTLPPGDLSGPRTVALAFPGAGYGRGYFDIEITGLVGYSQAEHHAGRGWIFVGCDHLGSGESSPCDPESLSFEVLAAADDAAATAVISGLRAGTLLPGVDPIDVAGTIGIGHSMGGCLLVVTQGIHRTFDAVAVLGFSAVHTVLPSPTGSIEVGVVDRGETHLVAASQAADLGQAVPFDWAFHWDDVPTSIIEQDIGEGFPLRRGPVPPWGSVAIPPAAITMLTPRVVAAEASAIDVPVFIGAGERDVVPTPHAEPGAYLGSRDVTVTVIPRMAHMHNFAGSRAALWNRMHRWGDTVLDG